MQDATPVHLCQCAACLRSGDHADRSIHRKMNLLLGRLDEQQRRWYVALESVKVGHGGDALLSQITGLNAETIRRGREELESDLQGRPTDRVRLPGGGRTPLEKKTPPWKAT
jgi:hypothetical protein